MRRKINHTCSSLSKKLSGTCDIVINSSRLSRIISISPLNVIYKYYSKSQHSLHVQ